MQTVTRQEKKERKKNEEKNTRQKITCNSSKGARSEFASSLRQISAWRSKSCMYKVL